MSKSTYLEADGGGQGVGIKKRTASSSAFSNSIRFAGDQLRGSRATIIGEQDGRLVVTEILDKELAEVALARAGLLFIDARRSVLALNRD
jgi:hypothetical protein